MKLLCPKCSSECDVAEQQQSTLNCPSCGLALFLSTSIRGRISSTRVGQLSQRPASGAMVAEPLERGVSQFAVSQQTVSYLAEPSNQPPELALVPQRLGRYEVMDFLGSGAFSRVYLAKDTELGRLVALKVPRAERFKSPGDLATFLREARTIAGLDHPGIVAVYDVAADVSGLQFIVMQYICGMTLQDRIASGPMTYWEAADILCRVAEAIHVAHKRQVFHRDLKPANILLDNEGRPHVADFGLAVLEHQQQQHVGEVAGTLLYMAPEQIRGEAQWLDGRSDIWSLGTIFYSLLAGRHPFLGKSKKVTDEILHREPRPPRQIDERIPKELERICLKCLAKPVRERYFSAFDLAEDLKQWMRTEGSASKSDSNASHFTEVPSSITNSGLRTQPATRSKVFAIGLAGALVLAIAAFVGAHFSKRNSDDANNRLAAVATKRPTTLTPDLSPKPTPFKLDTYAVPGRWHPLLEDKPRIFSFTPWATSKWSYDAQLQELLFDVSNSIYLDLGETKATKFTLEATFVSRNWQGSIGLYWGRKDFPTLDPTEGDQPQCHVVFVDSFLNQGKLVSGLRRNRVTFKKIARGGFVLRTSGISAESIPLPDNQPQRLELQITRNRLRVFWKDQPMEEMLEENPQPGPAELSPTGCFGIYASGGTFQVSDVRIRVER